MYYYGSNTWFIKKWKNQKTSYLFSNVIYLMLQINVSHDNMKDKKSQIHI